jgi:hypothetical protein
METKNVRSRATRLMPTATKKAMATAAREGNGGMRDGDGDLGCGQQRWQW